MPTALASALTTVATSPYAFVAYVVLVAVWGYVIVAGSRLRRITSIIDQIPEKDRALASYAFHSSAVTLKQITGETGR